MNKKNVDFPLNAKIAKSTGKAVSDFSMIRQNDRILVGLSGGKDSDMLLYSLCRLRKISPVPFEVRAVSVDPTGGRADMAPLAAFARDLGIALEVVRHPIFEIVDQHPGVSACSMCANLRRGILASAAQRLDCNVLALGHHKDDAVETVLMNLFYTGRFACFHPHMYMSRSQIRVIRPMVYTAEAEIIKETIRRGFPLIDFECRHAAASQRSRIKSQIETMSGAAVDIKSNVIRALRKSADAGAWGNDSTESHIREDW